MPYFAEIKDGKVAAIYQAETALHPSWVEASVHVRTGMTWTPTLLSELSVSAALAAKEAIHDAIVAATSRRLADFAATRGYSSLDAISKYKDITDAEIASLPVADQPLMTKFRSECRYVALVTAQTWAVLYRGLAEVQAGTRPMPAGYDEIKDELPALAWPV